VLAKTILTDDEEVLKPLVSDLTSLSEIRGHLLGEYVMGRDIILAFLIVRPGAIWGDKGLNRPPADPLIAGQLAQ
jgi:hypothetical protein